jgi:NADPH-dependent ferric siderophore reductase
MEVRRTEHLTPRLARLTFSGPELAGFTITDPAASVRLLLPPTGTASLELPIWNGNEFLAPDGSRPIIRTFTPRCFDDATLELDLDIVLHDGGTASEWARRAGAGDPAAVSGPGRGYPVDSGAPAFLLAGDETALPAISQLIEMLPAAATVEIIAEIAADDARLALPEHPRLRVTWAPRADGGTPGNALLATLETTEVAGGTKVWVAGEAGAMYRVRQYLFDDLGLDRADVTVRGYWKHGR